MKAQEEVIKMLKQRNPQHYKKKGVYEYEIAETVQEIHTDINGQRESKKVAKVGDFILTGAAGERYPIRAEKFHSRYKILDKTYAVATGMCWAAEYKGSPFTFVAPWGDEMVCLKGDYLASDNAEITDVYRIEREVFGKSYKIV